MNLFEFNCNNKDCPVGFFTSKYSGACRNIKCPDCGSDDVTEVSSCCGEPINQDIRLCPECKEHV